MQCSTRISICNTPSATYYQHLIYPLTTLDLLVNYVFLNNYWPLKSPFIITLFTQKLYICVHSECSSVPGAHAVQVIYLSDFVQNIYSMHHFIYTIRVCIYLSIIPHVYMFVPSRDMSLIIIYDWKRTASVYAPIRHGRHNGSANKSLTWSAQYLSCYSASACKGPYIAFFFLILFAFILSRELNAPTNTLVHSMKY